MPPQLWKILLIQQKNTLEVPELLPPQHDALLMLKRTYMPKSQVEFGDKIEFGGVNDELVICVPKSH